MDFDLIACAGQLAVAGAIGAAVLVIFFQGAVLLEKFHHCGLFVRRQRLIESALLHTLGQQLGDIPTSVVDDLPLGDGFAAEDVVILQQRAARGVHLDFELDSEFLAIAENILVDRRESRGAAVEIISFVEGALLRRAVIEDEL